MASLEKIRVGVVGVGKMGGYHLQKYLEIEEAELVGFSETDSAKAAAVQAKFGVPNLSLSDLLFEVDAITIASPTDTHAAIARQALEAGIHVLIEKPIASTVPDAEALTALAKAKGLVLQVGMVERFRLAALANGVPLQGPLFVETHRLSPNLSREAAIDVVSDLMIHDLDLALSLVDQDPISVSAIGMRVMTAQHDIANVRMEFAGGAVMNLNVSRVSAEPVRKLRVFFKDAYASFDFSENTAAVFRRVGAAVERTQHEASGVDPLREQARDFLHCVRTGRRPLVAGEDGVRALKFAKVVMEKIREREAKLQSSAILPRPEADL